MRSDFSNLEIEIVTSRRALIDVIIGLADHREALTVLGGHAVSATRGTELSTIDRQWRTLRAFDSGPAVDAYVAGPSALLAAKASKIHDRLDPAELRPNAERLRPKDFADLYRLLLAVTPKDAADLFARGIADQRIGEAVSLARGCLVKVLTDAATVATMVADSWGDSSREAEFRAQVDDWCRRFTS